MVNDLDNENITVIMTADELRKIIHYIGKGLNVTLNSVDFLFSKYLGKTPINFVGENNDNGYAYPFDVDRLIKDLEPKPDIKPGDQIVNTETVTITRGKYKYTIIMKPEIKEAIQLIMKRFGITEETVKDLILSEYIIKDENSVVKFDLDQLTEDYNINKSFGNDEKNPIKLNITPTISKKLGNIIKIIMERNDVDHEGAIKLILTEYTTVVEDGLGSVDLERLTEDYPE